MDCMTDVSNVFNSEESWSRQGMKRSPKMMVGPWNKMGY